MHKIILLSVFIIASFTTNAQRYANITVRLDEPVIGDTLITDEPFMISATIFNNGPDTMRITDSFGFELVFDSSVINFNFGSGPLPYIPMSGNELVPGDSTVIGFNFTLFSGWPLGGTDFCAGLYCINVVDSLHDTLMTDNRSCALVTVDRDRTSVKNLSLPGSVQVYPNPANGIANFDIQLAEPASVNIAISDVMGKTVIQHNKAVQNITKETISLSTGQLVPGMYFYTVTAGKEQVRGKLEIR